MLGRLYVSRETQVCCGNLVALRTTVTSDVDCVLLKLTKELDGLYGRACAGRGEPALPSISLRAVGSRQAVAKVQTLGRQYGG